MITSIHNRVLALGALWGLVLAALPAALSCASLSGAIGTLVAGSRAVAVPFARRGLLAISGVGALQGLVSGTFAALSIWLALATTISEFSAGSSLKILSLLGRPEIFVESATAAVFVYTVAVGILLSPSSERPFTACSAKKTPLIEPPPIPDD
jgi:hypothetical protein